MKVDSLICPAESSILRAMEIINGNGKGVVFVVDGPRRLRGVVSDGDIRRALIAGSRLEENISSLLHDNYVTALDSEPYQELVKKFNERIRIIPIINQAGDLVDYSEHQTMLRVPIAAPDLAGNEYKYLVDAFLSSWISSSGAYIEKFENAFAAFCGCRHGVATTNGTVALHLALVALGVGPGDEVIIPDLTFAATANAVLYTGATPVIVDIEPEGWCIDPKEIEKAITPKTKVILPVHLYGQPCDMAAIMKLAKKHKLFVVEDCAEAHGARFEGQRVGSFGDISCFSFYANKIITTGEGGMCVTNNEELYQRMRTLRDHGMSREKKYWHDSVGFNYRMTNLQAAIGLAQLERVEEILLKRQKAEEKYRSALSGIWFMKPQHHTLPGREKITWLISFIVDHGNRDAHIEHFKNEGIDTRPFFYPLSDMEIYKPYTFSNRVSRQVSYRGISFPTANNMSKEVIARIKAAVKKILDVQK